MSTLNENFDHLVDDLKSVLLKNRSSLSVPDIEKLESVIRDLEMISEVPEPSVRKLLEEEVFLRLFELLTHPSTISAIGQIVDGLLNS